MAAPKTPKTADLRSVLAFQERDSEGNFQTVFESRGMVEKRDSFTIRDFTEAPTVTHTFVIRQGRKNINKGMRIFYSGVGYVIGNAPEPLEHAVRDLIEIQAYKSDDAEALEQIEGMGRDYILMIPKESESSGPAFDRGSNSDVEYDELPIKALQTKYTSFEIDGSRIRSTDLRLLIGGDVQLSGNMKVRDGNQVYSIRNIDSVYRDGVEIMFDVQVR